MPGDDGTGDGYDTAVGDAAFVLLLRERGVRDTAVLRAMERVPRERFAPAPLNEYARRDIALPLAHGQSMSAPTKIAAMLTALRMSPGQRVLEIGTGSGYVTALLLDLGADHVQSLERDARLAKTATEILLPERRRVSIEHRDGFERSAAGAGGGDRGFDRILMNGHCDAVPAELRAALAPGGRLVSVIDTANGPSLGIVDCVARAGFVSSIGQKLRLPRLNSGRVGGN